VCIKRIKRRTPVLMKIFCLSAALYSLFDFTACIRRSRVTCGHRSPRTLLSLSCTASLEPIRVGFQRSCPRRLHFTSPAVWYLDGQYFHRCSLDFVNQRTAIYFVTYCSYPLIFRTSSSHVSRSWSQGNSPTVRRVDDLE